MMRQAVRLEVLAVCDGLSRHLTSARHSLRRLALRGMLSVLAIAVTPVLGLAQEVPFPPGSHLPDIIDSLRHTTDLGDFAFDGMGDDLEVTFLGMTNDSGDLLPHFRMTYPRSGATPSKPATMRLGAVRGSLRRFTFDGLFTVSAYAPSNRVFVKAQAGKMTLEVQAIQTRFPTGFGKPIRLDGHYVRLANTTPLSIGRPSGGGDIVSTGVFQVAATDLATDTISLRFEGEANSLEATANVTFPGQSLWRYDLATKQTDWTSGTLRVQKVAFVPSPVHPINFGGIEVALQRLDVGRLSVVKAREKMLASATMENFSLSAGTVKLAHPQFEGTLSEPLVVKSVTALCRSRQEFFDVYNVLLNTFKLSLNSATFRDEKGLAFKANTASLAVAAYSPKETGEGDKYKDLPPAEVPKPADASIDAALAMSGVLAVLADGKTEAAVAISALDLHIAGNPDKANGTGSVVGTFANGSTRVSVPASQVSKALPGPDRDNLVTVDIKQVSAFSFAAVITLKEGVSTVTGDAALITATFDPQYFKAEWDQPAFDFVYTTLCYDPPSLPDRPLGNLHPCDQKVSVQVHWLLELHPSIPKTGFVKDASFKIDKDGFKLCGGRALLMPGLWTQSVGPNLRDCGAVWCNAVRDAIRGAELAFGTMAGTIVAILGGLVLPAFPLSCS
jgi:hypothetical protein